MSELESRLLNWGLCMRDGYKQGRCRSIEHRYMREGILYNEERRQAKPCLDHLDADLIEAALRGVTVRLQQQVLRLEYVWKAPPAFTCRQLGIQQAKDNRHYLLELGKAHRAIAALLDAVSHHRKSQDMVL